MTAGNEVHLKPDGVPPAVVSPKIIEAQSQARVSLTRTIASAILLGMLVIGYFGSLWLGKDIPALLPVLSGLAGAFIGTSRERGGTG